MTKPIKRVGVWIDSNRAFMVMLTGKRVATNWISSDVDHFHYHEGWGSSTPDRFQAVPSEKKLIEKRKHQLDHYFKRIQDQLKDVSSILIFGPAETKNSLSKMLREKIDTAVITVETTDSMTENQMVAYVKKALKI